SAQRRTRSASGGGASAGQSATMKSLPRPCIFAKRTCIEFPFERDSRRAPWHAPGGGLMSARASQEDGPGAGRRVYVESPWPRPQKTCRDLREFLALLESRGELKRIGTRVDPRLELTEISRRTLA